MVQFTVRMRPFNVSCELEGGEEGLMLILSSSQAELDHSLVHSHWSSSYITALSLVELLHYCALIGREAHSGEIFSSGPL